jgi:hypothetical protein
MSASLLLKGSPAGLSDLGDGTVSFQNAALQGVKSINGGDAAGLAIVAGGAGGLLLNCATAGGVVVGAAGQSVGFHGTAATPQTTQAAASAAVVAAGAGAPVLADTTFGVAGAAYTVGQIVTALKLHGIIA